MSMLALLSNFGGPDLIIILLIVLVLFGAKKLPELAKGMGQAVKEFQKAKDEFSDELHNAGKLPRSRKCAGPRQAWLGFQTRRPRGKFRRLRRAAETPAAEVRDFRAKSNAASFERELAAAERYA